MLAEILTIGDELCRGEIVDTNSTWFAQRLWELDIAPAWMTSCRDVEADMTAALVQAAGRADLVVVSGGLGATDDDLTVDVVSKLLGCPARVDEEARARWLERFRAAGREPNIKTDRQLRVPEVSRVHPNLVGAAPGFEVTFNNTPIVCMPGVPREVESIWNSGLADRLSALRDARGNRVFITHRTFRAFGMGESDIATKLDGLFGEPADGESIHYRVKFPEILIKIVVRGKDQPAAVRRLDDLASELRERLGWLVYGVEQESFAEIVGRELSARGQTIACAESCTGGLLGAEITAVAGSSAYFLGGIVTYSNEAKIELLGVSSSTIEKHGVVSEACAIEMARGVREKLGADFGLSITGVAGPGGGTKEKPVGTVWLGFADDNDAEATPMRWPGPRDQVRRLAAFRAIAILRRHLSRDTRD